MVQKIKTKKTFKKVWRLSEKVLIFASAFAKKAGYIDTELKLPRFNPERPAVDELRELAQAGLKEKGLDQDAYQERLANELSVIHQMGFDDYFLIVWDLLRFGRSQGYYMGMGRGSAVGSLVAYVLNITGIDQIGRAHV